MSNGLTTAEAAVIQQSFNAPIMIEYDTNPTFLDQDKKGIWRYLVVPRYGINLVDGVNTWYADGRLTIERSSDHDIVIDREDPAFNLGWIRELQNGKFSLKAGYEESSSRINEIQRLGRVFGDDTRRTRIVEANLEKSLSEKLMLLTDFIYEKTTYTGIDAVNYWIPTLRVAMSYALNERVEPFAEVKLSELNPDGLGDSRYAGALVGARFNVSEAFGWNIRGGWTSIDGDQTDDGWQGGVGAKYKTEKTLTNVDLVRQVEPSGVGEYVEVDSLTADYSYELSALDNVGVNGYVSKHESRSLDFKYNQIAAFYSRDLTDNWNARLSLAHRQLKIDSDDKVYSNAIGVTLTYNILNF
ncbi:hypothetical protein MTYP_00858 [Methylophilaceae bacterium]|nr:hypothetical protein MTYP_00858 [Methylophilaceae bacterium]